MLFIRWKIFSLIFFSLSVLVIMIPFNKKESIPIITYFPQTDSIYFDKHHTKLSSNNKEKQLYDWEIYSLTNKETYLRQDIGLLFQNHKLVSLLNKWNENTNVIKQNEEIKLNSIKNIQAIALHFAESHEKDNIYSTFTTSSYHSNGNDKLNLQQKEIFNHWRKLLNHFSIDLSNYHFFGLTELTIDQLVKFVQNENEIKIFGQLWEGIYKNYVIPALYINKNSTFINYEPLILIAKDQSEILVIFKLNGEYDILIQKI